MSELILSGLARLPNLCKANGNISVRKGGEKLGCLAQLNQLEGMLMIDLEVLDEAEKAAVIQKKSIDTLYLIYDDDVKLGVVEALQPNSELLNLSIRGQVLPNWIAIMTNLRKLHLFRVSSELPSLWKLPFSEDLKIRWWDGEYVGCEFLGVKQETHIVAFPSLKTLTFMVCDDWKEWEDISEEEEANISLNIMPCLTLLEINYRMRLKVLPHRLIQRLAASALQTPKGYRCPVVDQHYGTCTEQGNKASQIPYVEILYDTDG